jgi:ectoine hydroxylase-related dioxygenase (phytanoyl-CoA dioxygenase family)
LAQVVALRLHLDDSRADNGPLRVLPGTHTLGLLTESEIARLTTGVPAVDCTVPAGCVVVMRPLIVHASSKAESDLPRRVLHIEYARSLDLGDGLKLRMIAPWSSAFRPSRKCQRSALGVAPSRSRAHRR